MKNSIQLLSIFAAILLLQSQNLEAQNPCLTKKLTAIGRDSTPNDPNFWNSLDWWDLKTASHDLPDAPTRLEIKVADICGGTPANLTYQLYLDLDGNGLFDTRVSSDSTNVPGFVPFGNLSGLNLKRQFDFRPVPAAVFYNFSIEQSVSGNVRTGRVVWRGGGATVLPLLPYGRFGIEWFCGGVKMAAQKFLVQDVLPPEIACISSLTADIQPTKTVRFFFSDCLNFTSENYSSVIYSMRKARKATGFPLNSQGNPVGFLDLGCDDLGEQVIEIWAKDVLSNSTFRKVTVRVEDPKNYCQNFSNVKFFCLEKETGEPIPTASLILSVNQPPVNLWVDVNSPDGCFEVKKWFGGVPLPNFYGITPVKDTELLNGVDSTDLLLLTQHISGIKPLDSPYKLIAADVNRSGSVTSSDVVELKKLLDGFYSDFPNNTSWRFVHKNLMFPTPTNPFINIIDPPFMLNDSIVRMIGVKVGDLDNSADPSLLWQSDERRVESAFESGFQVFPNPTSGEVFLEMKNSPQPAFFEIFDALGRSLRRGELVEQRTRLDVSEFPAGQFFLKILSCEGQVSTQFLLKN